MYRLNEVKPEVGDLLCKNRPGQNSVTFENVKAGDKTHVDIVTSVDSDTQLTAIGGNIGNTAVQATQTLVRLCHRRVGQPSQGPILRDPPRPHEPAGRDHAPGLDNR